MTGPRPGRGGTQTLRYDTGTRTACARAPPSTLPMSRSPAPVPTAGRPAWHGLACVGLLLALVLTQWLGVVHGSMHVESVAAHHHDDDDGAHAHAHAWHASHPAPDQTFATWLASLLDGHGSAADCRLYDQISHGDCAPTPLLLPLAPARLAASALPVIAGQAVRMPAWAQARGPPRIR